MSRPTPLDRSALKAWQRITLRWSDNDAYGHVNNTVFYSWFDTAVNQWLVERGLLDIAGGATIGLVVETSCSYFAPLAYPGEVDIGLAVERLGSSSVTYKLGVFAPDESKAAAQGRFTHVYVDRATRRPSPLSVEWRAALESIST